MPDEHLMIRPVPTWLQSLTRFMFSFAERQRRAATRSRVGSDASFGLLVNRDSIPIRFSSNTNAMCFPFRYDKPAETHPDSGNDYIPENTERRGDWRTNSC